MNLRSKSALRKSRILSAAVGIIEILESRTLLTGVVLGPPVNLSASSVGISPVFANIADFNGDGKGDLFVANSASNSVSVLLGNGDGSFQTPDTIAVTGAPLPLATGNFTSSGHTDIVAGTAGDVSVILGNGNGTFQPAINIAALSSNHAIAVGNFINGGPLDIISVSNSATASNNAALIVTDGTGHGSSVTPFSLPHGSVAAVSAGDFNGDGNLDFAVLNQLSNSVTVYLGNGNGTFQAPHDFATGSSPTSLVVGNFTSTTLSSGRPELDIVTADSTGGAVSFLKGNGDGTFVAPVNSAVSGTNAGGGPLKVRLTDFNGDGKPDLLVLDSAGSSADATVLLGNGNGTFYTGALIATHGGTRNAIAAGDLSGPGGLTDAVVTDSSQVTALRNITTSDTTAPTATVDASQAAGSTASSTYNFTVTYTDAQQVDASTIGNGNLVVTFPAGILPGGATTQAATLVSQNLGNAASVQATYQITFPANLTTADNGTYGVTMNANSVKNANQIPVAAGSIGSLTLAVNSSTTQDTIAPTAAVDVVQVPGSTLASIYNFTVTYHDNVAVDTTTLGNGNLVVTYPDSSTQPATLVSTGLTNSSSVQATYQISFPANLTTANNGPYGVSITGNSVKDTSGNAVAAGSIGSINLAVSSSQPSPVEIPPTGDFLVSAPTGKLLTAVVSGSKQKSLAVTVVNNNASPMTGTITVTLYTSNTQIHDGTSAVLTQAVKKVKKLKHGKGFVVHFKAFNFPGTAGNYYLVADAALNGTLDSYDGSTATPIAVAQAFVDVKAISATPTKATLTAGKKNNVTLTVQSIGNVAIAGAASAATVDVSLIPVGGGTITTIAPAVPVKLGLKPSQTKNFKFAYTPATLPASGTYNLVLTIHLPGDNNAANNTVTSVGTVSF